MARSDKNLVSLVAAEHIGPTETGDNIDAKRVAGYVVGSDGVTWQRAQAGAGSANIVIDSNNTTTSTLTAGSTFTGTATDISNYSQINVELYARPGTIAGDGTNARASLYLEFSPNGTNWDISIPYLIRDPSLFVPIPLINVGKYFRLRYINDGGTAAIASLAPPGEVATTAVAQTQFRLQTQLLPVATKELGRTLDQAVSGSDPVTLTRSALMGRNPSNTIVNLSAGGISMSNNSTATLTSGSTFTGGWEDRLGYTGATILVKTDQLSASNGIQVEHSDTATGVVVRAVDLFTFDAASLANGHMFITLPLKSQYFRVKYQNGGTNQGSFFMETHLETGPTEQTQQQIEATLTSETDGVITRSISNAKDPIGGSYANVTRTPTDASSRVGHHVGVMKYDASAPIKPADTWKVTKVTASTGAATLLAGTSALANRVSVEVYNSDSTKDLHINTSAASITGGQYRTIAPGQGIVMELGYGVDIAGAAASGTVSAEIVEVADSTLPT